MKVRFKQSISSMAGSFAFNQVAEIPDELAAPWIKSGVCESHQSTASDSVSGSDAVSVIVAVDSAVPEPTPETAPAPSAKKARAKASKAGA